MPYTAGSTSALYEAIRSPKPKVLPDQPAISPGLKALLTRLLDKDPSTRISLQEVCVCVCVTVTVIVIVQT